MGTVASVLTSPLRHPVRTFGIGAAGLVASAVFFGPVETIQGLSSAATGVSAAYSAAKREVVGAYWRVECPSQMEAVKHMGSIGSATPEQLRFAAEVKEACTPRPSG